MHEKRVIWNEIRYLFAKPKDINRTTEIGGKKTPLFSFSYWIFAVTNRLFVTFFFVIVCIEKKNLLRDSCTYMIFCSAPLHLPWGPLLSTVIFVFNTDSRMLKKYLLFLTLTWDKDSHFRPCGHCLCFLFFSFCR